MTSRTPTTADVADAAKTVGALALLTAMLPVNLALTLPALLRRSPAVRVLPADERRTVLVSGGKMTKSLHLCRAFAAAGHRVVLVETANYRFTGHRFSRAVDVFHVVPSPTDPQYARALLDVVLAEGVDLYVPVCSPVASRHDAAAAQLLAPHCEVLHADSDLIEQLDDKYRFADLAASFGLPVPDTHLVGDAAQVTDFDFTLRPGPYVLKNISYDPVNRLDLTPLPRGTAVETARFARSKPITAAAPWILQEFVTGREWCTHSTAIKGEVVAYVCCASSAFQVNYASVDKPGIESWVRAFVAAAGVTGQVSFDFIETIDGTVRAIECNPRTHSAITTFGDLPALADAYLGRRPAHLGPLRPRAGDRPTYWLYHELWRMLSDPRRAAQRVAVIARGRDAVYDPRDPLPFLVLHHVQIPKLLIGSLLARRPWTRIDFNIGKLVEPGGD